VRRDSSLRRRGRGLVGRIVLSHVEKKRGRSRSTRRRIGISVFGCGASGDVIGFYIGGEWAGGQARVSASGEGAGAAGRDRRGKPDTGKRIPDRTGQRESGLSGRPGEKQARRDRRAGVGPSGAGRGRRWMGFCTNTLGAWRTSMRGRRCGSMRRRRNRPGRCFRLFAPTDMVWAGDVQHSIAKRGTWRRHARNGRRRWRRIFGRPRNGSKAHELPGPPRLCQCVQGRRQKERSAIVAYRFILGRWRWWRGRGFWWWSMIGSRSMTRGALLRWLREKAGLRMRAIVFTGGKSLHGWFDFPRELRDLARLRLMLLRDAR